MIINDEDFFVNTNLKDCIMKMDTSFRVVLAAIVCFSICCTGFHAEAKISSSDVTTPTKMSSTKPAAENNASKVNRGFQLLVLLKMLK